MEKLKTIFTIIVFSALGLSILYYTLALLYMAIMDPIIHEIKVKLGLKEKGSFKERNPSDILPSGFVKSMMDLFKGFN